MTIVDRSFAAALCSLAGALLLAAVAALASACGGKSAPRAAAPDCERDPMSCYRARLATCTDATQVWRVDVANVGVITVADSGLVRLDQPDRRLFGLDSRRWLACLTGCDACVPYSLDLGLSHEMSACHLGGADADAWNGHPSRFLVGLCEGRTRIRVRTVPALAPVRDALVATGVIAPGDSLAKQDGLVVETLLGSVEMIDVASVEKATCADLALPADRPLIAGRQAFAHLETIAPRLGEAHRAAAKKEAETRGPPLEDVLLRTLGQACLGARTTYDATEVMACLDARPDLDHDALAYEASIRWVQETSALVAPITRTAYDAPLCAAFTDTRE